MSCILKHLPHPILVCRLVTTWAPPEYAYTFVNGGTEYQLNPAVEVFAFGVTLGQLLGCRLWLAALSEDMYLQVLAHGQYFMPVSVHCPSLSAFLLLIRPMLINIKAA